MTFLKKNTLKQVKNTFCKYILKLLKLKGVFVFYISVFRTRFFKNITTNFSIFIVKFWKTIQKYCNILIPADKHDEGYSIIYRSRLVVFGVLIFVLVLMCRLVFLQTKHIYKHKTYGLSKKQPFSRLDIVDRNGKVLVNNIIVYDLYLQPSRMNNILEDVEKIQNIVPNAINNKKELLERIQKHKDKGMVFVKKGLTLEQKQQLIDVGVQGLFFETAEKRFYTSSATNSITGYCPAVNRCISGIEKAMNSYLKITDNEPLNLSIDFSAQSVLRNILYKRMLETNSQGAVGIIMKIDTGEVISAVSLPDCDYNDYSSCKPNDLFNRYSLGVYELGSIFKLFSSAIALQSGIDPYKKYERKEYKIGDFVIHDIDKKEQQGGSLNLIDMVKVSSNVGFAKLMEDINIKDQFVFLSNLGLLNKLNTELPELGRPIYPKKWSFANAVTISYGHGIAITPLHYVSAIASLLKNEPVRPTFLKSNDKQISNYHYLDSDKYDVFKDLMRVVVNSGAGRSAYIDQYDIGGKTGTANQIKNGKYDKHSMVLSFVAGVPMNKPEYVFFIMLDRPYTDDANNNINRAATLLGKTMGYIISTIGPILNIRPISK